MRNTVALLVASAWVLVLTTFASGETITWTGAIDTSWHTTGNWDLGRVPGAGDDVVIPDVASAAVNYTSTTTSIASLACAEPFVLAAGELSIAGPSTSTNSYSQSGGTLSGAGDITLSGAATWSGGTMSGAGTTTVLPGVSWGITGSVIPSLNRLLVNRGDCTWDASATFYLTAGGIFRNASGGVFRVRNDQAIQHGGGAVATFENEAGSLFEKSVATATTTVNNIALTNQGTVQLQSGTLRLIGDSSSSNGGAFQTAAGTSLSYDGAPWTFTSGSSLITDGTVSFSASAVTFDAGASFDPNGTVGVSGGSLTLNTDVAVPTLVMSGGTLNGAGALTVESAATWSGGTMSGSGTTTVLPGVSWSITGSVIPSLNRLLVNRGDCTWDASATFYLTAGGIFRNASGGAFRVRNNQAIQHGGGVSATFENEAGGLFEKSIATGTTTVNNISLTNQGTVQLQSGTLRLIGDSSSSNGGVFETAAGTSLSYDGAPWTFTTGSSLITDGTVSFSASAVTFDAGASFDPNGTVGVSGGSLTLNTDVAVPTLVMSGGTLNGAGALTVESGATWSGGTMSGAGTTTVLPGVSWGITGSVIPSLNRLLVNRGDCTWDANTTFYLTAGGIFRNASGGVFRVRNDQAIQHGGGAVATFENEAGSLFEKSVATATTTVNNIALTNQGTVQLQSGTLRLIGDSSSSNRGVFETAAGTSLSYDGAPWTFTTGSSLITDGTVSFSASAVTFDAGASFDPNGTVGVSGGSLTLNTDVAVPTLVMSGGTLNGAGALTVESAATWSGGTMSGSGTTTVLPGVSWSITGSVIPSLNRLLVNQGDCTWDANTTFYLTAGGIFRNASGGVFRVRNDQAIQHGGGAVATFENEAGGLFEKSVATGTTRFNNVPMVHDGTMRVSSGTVWVNAAFPRLVGTTLTAGDYDIAGTLQIDGANVVTNEATLQLDGATASFQDASAVNALRNLATNTSTASLALTNGSTLTLTGPLSNQGQVLLGPGAVLTSNAGYNQSAGATRLEGGTLVSSTGVVLTGGTFEGAGVVSGPLSNGALIPADGAAGTIEVTGAYTQTAAGRLEIEIGGTTPGAEFDVLAVGGTATLDGELAVSLINGFLPVPETAFDFLTAGSVVGTFSSDNLPLAYSGGCLDDSVLVDRVRGVSHAAPGIVEQPVSIWGCVGDTASFSVSVVMESPVELQWRHNGTDIPLANGTTLLIPSVAPSDSGSYQVVVTGTCGFAVSDSVRLTISEPPGITVQPEDHNACEGDSLTLTIVASGRPTPTFQWRKNGSPMSGQIASALTFAPADSGDTGVYDCVVTGLCGSATSDSAQIVVVYCPPPVGACCIDETHSCTVTTQAACGGVYMGDDTNCNPDYCPASDVEDASAVPAYFSAHSIRPNPTRGPVDLWFGIPTAGSLTAAVYDVGGRLVREFAVPVANPSFVLVAWDGNTSAGVPAGPGVYFVRGRLQAGDGGAHSTHARLIWVE